MALKLDTVSLMQISLFEKYTHARTKDCFEDQFKRLVFCVDPGELFKAIGKEGANVKNLEARFNRKLWIIEYQPTVEKFVAGLCYPQKTKKVEYESQSLWDTTKHIVLITPENLLARGYIIGKTGVNLRNMEFVCQRYFKVDEIRVTDIKEEPAQ
jgi:transcription termination/antitermination protein NusA